MPTVIDQSRTWTFTDALASRGLLFTGPVIPFTDSARVRCLLDSVSLLGRSGCPPRLLDYFVLGFTRSTVRRRPGPARKWSR